MRSFVGGELGENCTILYEKRNALRKRGVTWALPRKRRRLERAWQISRPSTEVGEEAAAKKNLLYAIQLEAQLRPQLLLSESLCRREETAQSARTERRERFFVFR